MDDTYTFLYKAFNTAAPSKPVFREDGGKRVAVTFACGWRMLKGETAERTDGTAGAPEGPTIDLRKFGTDNEAESQAIEQLFKAIDSEAQARTERKRKSEERKKEKEERDRILRAVHDPQYGRTTKARGA